MDVFSSDDGGLGRERPASAHRFGVLDEAGPESLTRAAQRLRPPADALRALRCWEFDQPRRCLYSIGYAATWWPGGTLVASCDRQAAEGFLPAADEEANLDFRSHLMTDLAARLGLDPEDGKDVARSIGLSGHPLDEAVPGYDCSCGVYAAKTIGVLVDGILPCCAGRPTVVGVVRLWGRIIEHESGYRAAMAAVEALYRPIGRTDADRAAAEIAERAADAFRVPCIPCLPWRPDPMHRDEAA